MLEDLYEVAVDHPSQRLHHGFSQRKKLNDEALWSLWWRKSVNRPDPDGGTIWWSLSVGCWRQKRAEKSAKFNSQGLSIYAYPPILIVLPSMIRRTIVPVWERLPTNRISWVRLLAILPPPMKMWKRDEISWYPVLCEVQAASIDSAKNLESSADTKIIINLHLLKEKILSFKIHIYLHLLQKKKSAAQRSCDYPTPWGLGTDSVQHLGCQSRQCSSWRAKSPWRTLGGQVEGSLLCGCWLVLEEVRKALKMMINVDL